MLARELRVIESRIVADPDPEVAHHRHSRTEESWNG